MAYWAGVDFVVTGVRSLSCGLVIEGIGGLPRAKTHATAATASSRKPAVVDHGAVRRSRITDVRLYPMSRPLVKRGRPTTRRMRTCFTFRCW